MTKAKASAALPHAKLRITWIGAYWIHPKHIFISIEVQTDAERDVLSNDRAFMAGLRQSLVDVNYPIEGREGAHFGIASQETVDRDFQGSWWYFYK